ncbi:MAG: hypothetical protein F4Y31_05305 [Gammaproteobacteria bacterium]|nr:hypothetical protein [Gammaproteobacteria bacterium]MYF66216.1 hypothetical protein [Gammaproteobacteria bacterium]MYK38223.1 hypothetical protein [Gammaproteobacteria bacterium]
MNKQETVIVTYHPTRESGRRKGWGKHVTGVDAQKKNGYAFEGAFLNTGENELPVGAAIIEKNPAGSVKNFYYVWRLGYVAGDGAIEWDEGEWNRSEFISFRNRVAERVAGETPDKAKKAKLLAERSRLESRIADIDAEIEAFRSGEETDAGLADDD